MIRSFSDTAARDVITTPRTPLPWINHLGIGAFFQPVSTRPVGTAYKDAKLRRITRYRYNNVPADSKRPVLYILDGDIVWNPGWQPTQTELTAMSAPRPRVQHHYHAKNSRPRSWGCLCR